MRIRTSSTRRRALRAAAAVLMMVAGAASARSTISTLYTFTASTGSQIDISSGFTQVNVSGADDASQSDAPYSIGFPFKFNGTAYTEFSVNTNGLMKLGGNSVVSATRFNEDFPSFGPPVGDMPFLAPLWDDLYIKNTGIRYKVTGTAPNRVLVVEWACERYSFNNLEDLVMQVRLYETSNIIEFQYPVYSLQPGYNQFTGLIAIAQSTSDYMRVVPGTPATAFTSGIATVTPPVAGTMYTFTPCQTQVTLTGNVAQGGTATMATGDSLLKNTTVMRGNFSLSQPFSVDLAAGSCTAAMYGVAVSGAAAADYAVTPAGGGVNAGGSQPISITFTPSAVGRRVATLTVTDSNGFSRSFVLAATGQSRITYTGNVAQGGTATMKDGDSLLIPFSVYNGNSVAYTPFSVNNINSNGSAPNAPVTYSIVGTSGGQYAVSPSSASLGASQSSTPVITFTPNSGGIVRDTLVVTADGNEVRRFVLMATGISPKASYLLAGELLDTTSTIFNKDVPCVGVQPATYIVKVANPGFGDLHITSTAAYAADTAFGQGASGYPLLRDGRGRAIPMPDYVVTTTPPVLPPSANNQVYPITVHAGDTAQLYVTFVGQRPTKRYARLYLYSDAVNFSSADTGNVMRRGLMRFNLVGRAVGSFIAGGTTGLRPATVTFPTTHVYDSSDMPLIIYNPGLCDLRIARHSVAITAGDNDEFEIVKLPSSRIDPVTNDVVIASGVSDTLMLRFKPLQMGSRRAGLRLQTNDSTMVIPGVTERGVAYIDLFGNGKADLYAADVDFGMALIGGGPTESIRRSVHLKNTLNGVMVITQIYLEGADTAEFVKETNPAWPALPLVLNGGKELDLGLLFAPRAGGQIGPRNAVIKLITLTGDTVVAHLSGIAGTRTIGVTPTTLNMGPISSNKRLRRTIAVTATGTMPLALQQPLLSPGTNFSVSSLPRLVVAPGQTEYIEVTYAPQGPGAESGVVTIGNNSSTGQVQVMLNGIALKTREVDVDPSQTVLGGDNGETGLSGLLGASSGRNASGVNGESAIDGVRLWQSAPNPARDVVEIRYSLAHGAPVSLELFDAAGRLVRVLDTGERAQGEQHVVIDVRGLASGVYHYRLTAGTTTLDRSMNVVR